MSVPTRLSRDLAHANKILADAFRAAESEFEALYPGVNVIITETYRPQSVQDAYFAQGRQTLTAVNALRSKAGLPMLTQAQNRSIITRATVSKHSTFPSNAIDIAFLNGRSLDYSNLNNFKNFANLMIKHGQNKIRWGGDWNRNGSTKDERFIDMPHFEVV